MCHGARALLAALVLVQLLTPAAAGWSLLKRAFGWGSWGGNGSGSGACKAVAPQKDVDLKAYTSKRWYIHQQVRGRWAGWVGLELGLGPRAHHMTFLSLAPNPFLQMQTQAGNPNGQWNFWCVRGPG